jgi:hypothetical protein
MWNVKNSHKTRIFHLFLFCSACLYCLILVYVDWLADYHHISSILLICSTKIFFFCFLLLKVVYMRTECCKQHKQAMLIRNHCLCVASRQARVVWCFIHAVMLSLSFFTHTNEDFWAFFIYDDLWARLTSISGCCGWFLENWGIYWFFEGLRGLIVSFVG